ncbi:MAG: ABC transporter ATP-binding protein [Gillisia sp.]
MAHTILKTKDLSIGYRRKGSDLLIAENIEVEINAGELTAVIGVNGVGKSTFLRSISGIQENLKGDVLIENQILETLSPEKKAASISLVLTEQPISKNLSVFELIALGRQPYTNWLGSLSRNDLREIKNAIDLVNVRALSEKKCYELSDGQLQKVLIARALAQNTSLIILDEPTTHLDIYHQAFVLKLLKELTRKTSKSIVFATHELNLALQLCDKILLMKEGKVISGTPEELFRNGTFKSLFPDDLIIFDEDLRSFKIKT